MSDAIIQNLTHLYQHMNKDHLSREMLAAVYSEDLHFEDSLHCVKGLDAFQAYCERLYSNVNEIDFEFQDSFLKGEDQAMLTWTLSYSHRRLNRGRTIQVPGASHIRFKDKVYFHKDYFDAGQLFYEHMPLFGSLVKFIKKHAADA